MCLGFARGSWGRTRSCIDRSSHSSSKPFLIPSPPSSPFHLFLPSISSQSKNHTNRNQSFKAHRNGIKKPKNYVSKSLKGVSAGPFLIIPFCVFRACSVVVAYFHLSCVRWSPYLLVNSLAAAAILLREDALAADGVTCCALAAAFSALAGV